MRTKLVSGRDGVAKVYVGVLDDGARIEFVESWDPLVSPEEKWVLIVSSLVGCPVCCSFCDAGGGFKRKLSREELLGQVDYLVRRRYPDLRVPVAKVKVQFARIGEPSFNPAVVKATEELAMSFDIPGLIPCVSTVAPMGRDSFFADLTEVKNRSYPGGRFQLQFSVHSTDDAYRRKIIPTRIWNLERIADFGSEWFKAGDRKVTLNFALAKGVPFDPGVLMDRFDPALFLIKITPVNPTSRREENGIRSAYPNPAAALSAKIERLRLYGYTVIESIGNLEENSIGSNCGQYLKRMEEAAGAALTV